MPRFFISLINGDGAVNDEEGRELPDLEAARRAALKAAGEIMADEMGQGKENLRIVLIVENEERERLLELPVTISSG
jgi:hypothetical protein